MPLETLQIIAKKAIKEGDYEGDAPQSHRGVRNFPCGRAFWDKPQIRTGGHRIGCDGHPGRIYFMKSILRLCEKSLDVSL